MRAGAPPTRYRFAEFTVNVSTRLLLAGDTEIPLIPRYFDLLVLLIERRHEAVTRDEIFDVVWHDVVVSDGALTQAIRSLRKCLSDRAKDPRFEEIVAGIGDPAQHDDVVFCGFGEPTLRLEMVKQVARWVTGRKKSAQVMVTSVRRPKRSAQHHWATGLSSIKMSSALVCTFCTVNRQNGRQAAGG